MVDSIQGNSRVNSVKISNIAKFKNTMAPALGLFGFGAKDNTVKSPMARLEKMFNFDTPVYHRGIQQLSIKDSDFIPDKEFEDKKYCEV